MQCLINAHHVAIITGFFIPKAQQPETDGPPGAVALARALLALGKKVTILSDDLCKPSVTACSTVIQNSFSPDAFSVSIFPEDKKEHEAFISQFCSTVDCLLSIERVGRSVDGSYRTMRGIDITQKTAPLDELFLYAKVHPELHITTIGIGDGGNEIGMGVKQEEVKNFIPQGALIGCVVPADYLVVAGVSNWGGYALSGALLCFAREQNKEISVVNAVYSSDEEQFCMLQNMVNVGCCDGVKGTPMLSVDGMDWSIHAQLLDQIRLIAFN